MIITSRTEIAKALNFENRVNLAFDLSKKDEYGWKGTTVKVVTPYRDHALTYRCDARIYDDECGKIRLCGHDACVSATESIGDYINFIEMNNSPEIKAETPVVVFFYHEALGLRFAVRGNISKRIDTSCMTVATVEFESEADRNAVKSTLETFNETLNS